MFDGRKYICVDLETVGLDPRFGAEMRIASIDGEVYDVWDEYQEAIAFEWLSANHDAVFVAHNAQFDLDHIYHKWPELEPWGGPIFDTMVAWQVMQAGRRLDYEKDVKVPAKLGYIAYELLGEEMDKQYQKAKWDGNPDNQMLHYASQDSLILDRLYAELWAGLKNAGLDKIFVLEMQLLPILLQAKRKGVTIDVCKAYDLIDNLLEQARGIEERLPRIQEDKQVQSEGALFAIAATNTAKLNPNSSQQVVKYFGTEDAQADTLKHYLRDNPDDVVAKDVLEVKKLRKKASSVEKQILMRVAEDGRIHPSFKQTFTDTGRLSCSDPNLQNQDRGKDIRSLYVAPPGKQFVIADYSQLELRLAAYYSRDKNMIKAYRDGRDLHDETMRRIFGDPAAMSDEERKKARTLSKNINFGLVYGGGAGVLVRFAFKNDVIITEEEAKAYRAAFRAAYPGLVKWQQIEGRTDTHAVYTYLGRRRFVQLGDGYNVRINNKIQGTAADGMKLAMVYLYRRYGILPLVNVHDEVIIECNANLDVEKTVVTVNSVMEDAMYKASGISKTNPLVPIEVEADIATDWSQKS